MKKTLDPISVLKSLSNSIPNLPGTALPHVPQLTLTWPSTAVGLKPSISAPPTLLLPCPFRLLCLSLCYPTSSPAYPQSCHFPRLPATCLLVPSTPSSPNSCRHHPSALASNAPRPHDHYSQPSQPLTFATKSLSQPPFHPLWMD